MSLRDGPTEHDAESPQDQAGRWDPRFDRRRPTTAEQAVPWLIAVILLLSGMVIVLLALIFNSDLQFRTSSPTGGIAGGSGAPGESGLLGPDGSGVIAPSPTPAATPAPTATPAPVFGALEFAYLAREAPAAPIVLMRQDFAVEGGPVALARAIEGVTTHDWAPDGSVGAALIANRAVALEPGSDPRALADGIVAMTFARSGRALYAVSVESAGGTDTARILDIDFDTTEQRVITEVSYVPQPVTFAGPLDAAAFADDGGAVRLHWLDEGRLLLHVVGGPIRAIDPGNGAMEELSTAPRLMSPDGERWIEVTQNGPTSALEMLNGSEGVLAVSSVPGVVSHLRWSPDGDEVVFTVGTVSAGAVLQDLYVWNLREEPPRKLTQSGAAFGAEWLGAGEFWRR